MGAPAGGRPAARPAAGMPILPSAGVRVLAAAPRSAGRAAAPPRWEGGRGRRLLASCRTPAAPRRPRAVALAAGRRVPQTPEAASGGCATGRLRRRRMPSPWLNGGAKSGRVVAGAGALRTAARLALAPTAGPWRRLALRRRGPCCLTSGSARRPAVDSEQGGLSAKYLEMSFCSVAQAARGPLVMTERLLRPACRLRPLRSCLPWRAWLSWPRSWQPGKPRPEKARGSMPGCQAAVQAGTRPSLLNRHTAAASKCEGPTWRGAQSAHVEGDRHLNRWTSQRGAAACGLPAGAIILLGLVVQPPPEDALLLWMYTSRTPSPAREASLAQSEDVASRPGSGRSRTASTAI